MAKINYYTRPLDSRTELLEFEIKGVLSSDDLKAAKPPETIKNGLSGKGIVLSGRGPVWLYGFLVHFYHPMKFVATFDPRLNGGVVVESHAAGVKVGDIIEIPNDIVSLTK